MKTRRIALFVVATTLGACSDAVAPGTRAAGTRPLMGGVTADLSMTDTSRFSIAIDPSQPSSFNLGAGHIVTFPAGSVCDPATSTYGPTQWDAPCSAASSTVNVSVKAWLNAKGHPIVDFTPNIRFVPSQSQARWVTIQFTDSPASLDASYSIAYCATIGGTCINEATTDASMSTKHDPVKGIVNRRIKHFSGYLVGAGSDSVPPSNRIGVSPIASPSSMRVAPSPHGRTGYILVSGRR